MRTPLALVTAATTLTLLAGCGSSSKSSSTVQNTATSHSAAASTSTTSSTPATSTGATSAVVVVTKHGKLGTILAAGPQKRTVYMFEADTGKVSTCTGACAAAWPPVTSSGAATAASGAMSADLGTITRSDGATQVTYHGHPLYFFSSDKDAGDSYGQGVKAFGADWYVLKPSGEKVDES